MGVYSLAQGIFAGIDWDNMVEPLRKDSVMWVWIYMIYILFCSLCMMNVITGISVQSALAAAHDQQELVFENKAIAVLSECGTDSITLPIFEACLEDACL